MNDKDTLLVMTICELLEKSASPLEVERAYQKAQKTLERWRQRRAESSRDSPG